MPRTPKASPIIQGYTVPVQRNRYPQTSNQRRPINHIYDSNLSQIQHVDTYKVNFTLPSHGLPEKPADKRHLDSQNRSVQNNIQNDRTSSFIPAKDESAGKGTLSNMLDKTEGELNVLRRQFENNAGAQDSRAMLDTLNTAKHQVENLKSTAEKVMFLQFATVSLLNSTVSRMNFQSGKIFGPPPPPLPVSYSQNPPPSLLQRQTLTS